MLLREPLTSSMKVLLLARGAGSDLAVGYSVAPAVSNAAPFESCAFTFVRHCFKSCSERQDTPQPHEILQKSFRDNSFLAPGLLGR